ncbi:dnaJ homolog subfamily C member 11 [Schistocerca gregaria]|uniref:dnaJ homolog subfamily C member 11 n=1 Tax=Schistocerca gregaria TaxID=7010 RepID=UPI00211E4BDB|nr:dnaJ homolog subfamily C member 11 [Schistocerca gregaria]
MDDESDVLIEEDYYSFLNIPRDATNEQINNAYRHLSRMYHPDKHVDPERKKEAEILFNKTKKAYEVLSDPHQRAIYDTLGTRGLKADGWEIVQRTKTPQEIREEYERLAREREERRLQQRTNPKGNVTVHINATDLFSRYEDDLEYENIEPGWFPLVEVSGMSFSQSTEAPITLRDTVTLSGQLAMHNGTGQGTVGATCRHLLSDRGWVETEIGIGGGPMLSLRTFRTLSKRTFANASMTFQSTPHGLRPGLVLTLATQLDRHTVGYLTWRVGPQSAMSTTVVRDTPESHASCTLQFGVPHSYLGASYSRKMEERDMKLRAAARAGTFGALVEVGCEKKVSEHSSVSAAVTVGLPVGVSLKLKLGRGSQTYVMPIHLCEEVLPAPVFYATVTPIVIWAVVKKLVVDPIARGAAQREKERQREANKARMAETRREAQAAVELMRATFARVRADEEARRGLVVVRALYGRLMPTTTGASTSGGGAAMSDIEDEVGSPDEVIDVTVPLQCLVRDSQLVLHESSKSQLPGFYDPCLGEEKALRVQYTYHGLLHEVTVGDTESVRLPKQAHRLNPTT